jgi:hypothetical protein
MSETENGNWVEENGESSIWLPKVKDEELAGEVVEIRQGTYGLQVGVRTDGGRVLYTPSHKALQSRLVNLKLGDSVRIVFRGEDVPRVKGRNPAKLYSVFVRRFVEEKV